jgi:uncharacterized membrane protein YhaH (DUF805 family)
MNNIDPQMVLVLVAVCMFAPTITVWNRRHCNRLAIIVCNVMALAFSVLAMFPMAGLYAAGISSVCWTVALVWACTNNVRPFERRFGGKSREIYLLSRWQKDQERPSPVTTNRQLGGKH